MRTGVRVTKGILEASRVIRRFKPDVIIGTGGYVCFPVIVAGKLYGARTFLHEQNAYPGLATAASNAMSIRYFWASRTRQNISSSRKKWSRRVILCANGSSH